MSKRKTAKPKHSLGAAVSAYTGFLLCDFADMQAFIEEVMGHPVWTHQLANAEFVAAMRQKMKDEGYIDRMTEAMKGVQC